MAKGDKCIISGCNRIISKGRKGKICGTHQFRKRKFGSYDLPGYTGRPNYPVYMQLPEGIVKICDKHGELTVEEVYKKNYKCKTNSYNCKKCMLDGNIRRKYQGMKSLDDYDLMLAAQGGVCGSCKGQNTTTRNGKIKRFAIDHCHKTQKVRGLLCAFCNALIGYAKDSIETLQSAIEYLKFHMESDNGCTKDVTQAGKDTME